MTRDPSALPLVKFVGRVRQTMVPTVWSRQIVGGEEIGGVRFTFDPAATTYDWFAVYDNLPPYGGPANKPLVERLACPPQNTILITSEPSSVRRYPLAFLRQFAVVISSQEPDFLRHPGQVHTQGGLRWYYGLGKDHMRTVEDMLAHPPLAKDRLLSTITSAKRQTHTLHAKRHDFISGLAAAIPELERFGHGIRDIDDKADAMDRYRYHVAVENHRAPHHWTEKLSDSFLACTLPFYVGAPNAADYFPADSFIALDINDVPGSVARIREAMAQNVWEKRLPAILEARRLVIERYGLFSVVGDVVKRLGATPAQSRTSGQSTLRNAGAARLRHPLLAIKDLIRHKTAARQVND